MKKIKKMIIAYGVNCIIYFCLIGLVGEFVSAMLGLIGILIIWFFSMIDID